jgi:hypothetical protein
MSGQPAPQGLKRLFSPGERSYTRASVSPRPSAFAIANKNCDFNNLWTNTRWRESCKPDANLEAGAVAVFMARCDHSDAAPNNGTIMLFQQFYLTLNFISRSLDRLCTFEGQLQWDFHIGLLSPR